MKGLLFMTSIFILLLLAVCETKAATQNYKKLLVAEVSISGCTSR